MTTDAPYIVPRIPTTSSSLASFGYDPQRQVLAVEFSNGTIFHYGSVAAETFDQFMQAESKGRFFAQNIKGKYPGEKMTGLCPQCGDLGIAGLPCTDCGCGHYEKEPYIPKPRAAESAQPCGCDAGAKWVCERHRREPGQEG